GYTLPTKPRTLRGSVARSASLPAASQRIYMNREAARNGSAVPTEQRRAGVPLLLEGADEQFPRVEHLWVDQGYTGTVKSWIEEHLGWRVEVVRHPPHPRGEWLPHGDVQDWRTVWFSWQPLPPAPKVFRGVLPRRWVVERTFAWLCQN